MVPPDVQTQLIPKLGIVASIRPKRRRVKRRFSRVYFTLGRTLPESCSPRLPSPCHASGGATVAAGLWRLSIKFGIHCRGDPCARPGAPASGCPYNEYRNHDLPFINLPAPSLQYARIPPLIRPLVSYKIVRIKKPYCKLSTGKITVSGMVHQFYYRPPSHHCAPLRAIVLTLQH